MLVCVLRLAVFDVCVLEKDRHKKHDQKRRHAQRHIDRRGDTKQEGVIFIFQYREVALLRRFRSLRRANF